MIIATQLMRWPFTVASKSLSSRVVKTGLARFCRISLANANLSTLSTNVGTTTTATTPNPNEDVHFHERDRDYDRDYDLNQSRHKDHSDDRNQIRNDDRRQDSNHNCNYDGNYNRNQDCNYNRNYEGNYNRNQDRNYNYNYSCNPNDSRESDKNSNGSSSSRYHSWNSRSSVKEPKGEFLYGSEPVIASLRAQRRERYYGLYVLESVAGASPESTKGKTHIACTEAIRLAEEHGVRIERVNRNSLDQMSGQRPANGVVLDVSPLFPPYVKLLAVPKIDDFESSDKNDVLVSRRVWVVLDQVVDPQNLGAILRSSLFFGVEGVVICSRNSAPLSPIVAKASCGALESINLRVCKSMPRFLSMCEGWDKIGMSLGEEAISWKKLTSDQKALQNVLLVFGNEGFGLRTLVEKQCTQLAKITGNLSPTSPNHSVHSLNVSTTLGVSLFQLLG